MAAVIYDVHFLTVKLWIISLLTGKDIHFYVHSCAATISNNFFTTTIQAWEKG
jgi:hypothetical protein